VRENLAGYSTDTDRQTDGNTMTASTAKHVNIYVNIVANGHCCCWQNTLNIYQAIHSTDETPNVSWRNRCIWCTSLIRSNSHSRR